VDPGIPLIRPTGWNLVRQEYEVLPESLSVIVHEPVRQDSPIVVIEVCRGGTWAAGHVLGGRPMELEGG